MHVLRDIHLETRIKLIFGDSCTYIDIYSENEAILFFYLITGLCTRLQLNKIFPIRNRRRSWASPHNTAPMLVGGPHVFRVDRIDH